MPESLSIPARFNGPLDSGNGGYSAGLIAGFMGGAAEVDLRRPVPLDTRLDVVREARFASAFTFQYSKRPGTPAAEFENQIAPEVVTERYGRLVALLEEISWDEAKKQVGRSVEVLVAAGEGRKDVDTLRMSGRARDNRLVHFAPNPDAPAPRPGDVVSATVTYAAPHHLVADGPVSAPRRTRGGDAWQAAQERPAPVGVSLGMPGVGAPV